MRSTSYLSKEIFITDTQNAFFSAVAVVVALSLSQLADLGMATGFFVVGMQSVTGLNIKGQIRNRIVAAAKAVSVLIGTALLAVATKDHIALAVLGAIALAFSFGYWRQVFPLNWPDVNIPAGVIFFMAMSDAHYSTPVSVTAIGGGLGLLSQLLLCIILPGVGEQEIKATENILSQNGNAKEESAFILQWSQQLKLRPDLLLYSITLSVLLAIGVLIDSFTSYGHGYWMPFTAIVVLQVSHTHTVKRIGERMVGTLCGCLLGSGLLLLHLPPVLHIGLVACNIFLFLYYVRKHYAVAVIFITVFVLLLLGSHSSEPLQLALERILFTLAGGALTFIISFALLHKRQL
ncbi:FUSC family protein [Pontibacter sp. SGAir0037]|uniref:FUSC family protein n=1 Tax=Pontibacter sp. SGAir0037 TaxID=2571030 RepID=UPI0010CCC004|nr:FUSC family protein [Pontibacter sp. SGAir0037]QCR21102.1 hypothetical protein C1N53_01125 [Pontibacter sp. SGAir0037]